MSDFEHLNHYELLGVARTASPEEIKRAYRREISKYHPDRFVNATDSEKVYAEQRSQRLTEAYSVLSNLGSRQSYNRSKSTATTAQHSAVTTPPPPRDHQAELYEQAQIHLEAGRLLQAIGSLRQLQKINPFYRDSAELLANAETELHRRSDKGVHKGIPHWLPIVGTLLVVCVLVGIGVWIIDGGNTAASLQTRRTPNASAAATALPSAAPEPTALPAMAEAPTTRATVVSEPTAAPTKAPTTAAPTTEPTAEPSPEPTSQPTLAPSPSAAVEGGALLLGDDFSGDGWADLSGPGWSVGYQDERYHIRGNVGTGAIWSYRTSPARNATFGVDVQITRGEGGLLVRFANENSYTSVTLNPSQTSFRVEEHGADTVNVLAGGQSEAIAVDAVNRIVARSSGNRLQIFVNGTQLADVEATNANGSRYGLVVIAKEGASDAFFDNLEIRRLSE